ncbi:MAG: D-alanyl-D-alanine carboxypeptidase, partial [Clostridia bacterium]|nr:D-alanyl-D-alanine carboxypeptidase [Clostridia bacterium]
MKKLFVKFFLAIMLCCLVVGFSVPESNGYATGNSVQIKAKSALLIDYHSGKVLFEKNATDRLPIASMTKLASLAVIFDALDKGVIKKNDDVIVSETAAAVGGSSAFLDAGSSYKVSELIKSIVVASANDSTVALAEFVAGTEELFVSRMNKFARDLNLNDTNFENSTGLPTENHYSSAFDMAHIYKTMCNNELYKKYAKIWMDDFIHPTGRKTGLVNTNRLVKTYDGLEGGKTGYTDSARFCLTASASRGGL